MCVGTAEALCGCNGTSSARAPRQRLDVDVLDLGGPRRKFGLFQGVVRLPDDAKRAKLQRAVVLRAGARRAPPPALVVLVLVALVLAALLVLAVFVAAARALAARRAAVAAVGRVVGRRAARGVRLQALPPAVDVPEAVKGVGLELSQHEERPLRVELAVLKRQCQYGPAQLGQARLQLLDARGLLFLLQCRMVLLHLQAAECSASLANAEDPRRLALRCCCALIAAGNWLGWAWCCKRCMAIILCAVCALARRFPNVLHENRWQWLR